MQAYTMQLIWMPSVRSPTSDTDDYDYAATVQRRKWWVDLLSTKIYYMNSAVSSMVPKTPKWLDTEERKYLT